LQAIAGARHAGAETFFVRLAQALQRAGENRRVLIRREPGRLSPRDRAVAPGDRIELDEPGDAALPAWRLRPCRPSRRVFTISNITATAII
jgi:hypothetical protein